MVETKTSFGAFEAKTHFSNLLDRVEQGDRIVITRHGRAVATLAPVQSKPRKNLVKLANQAWESTKGTRLPEGTTVRDLIYSGRKR